MSEAETLAPDAGLPPIPLLANSYSLPDLMKASDHLAELKTERGREENAANLAVKLALNQDVVQGLYAPALPPDHTLRNVEDSSGVVVRAPVPIPEDGFDGDEPALDPNAGVSAGGARDEDLPPREDPNEVMGAAVATIADAEGAAQPVGDERPADPAPEPEDEPDATPKPRRKRSTN